jgi:surfactin synthase thioesterase subunit
VLAVQAPGKGWRIHETPISDLHRLADAVADAVVPLADRPFVLFGHSMGAWTGWEVTRRLEERGVLPTRLVVSGRQAPSAGHLHEPLGHLPDREFVAAIQARYGGIPEAILDEPDILELLLPALRADVEALEGYEPPARPVSTPILAIGGASDPVVPPESVEGWRDATEGEAEVLILPGGHFFLEDEPRPFFGALHQACGASASPAVRPQDLAASFATPPAPPSGGLRNG